MPTNSTIGMIRRRWLSRRPYVGHATESLRRKISCEALSDRAKHLARIELRLRGEEIAR